MPLNETTYAAKLAANPTKKYGIYNNKVYDFTGFYSTIGAIVPGVQEVTDYNAVTANVATQISATTAGAQSNIFEVLPLVPAPVGTFLGIFQLASPEDTYEPVTQYTNDQIRTFLLANPSKYIIRWFGNFWDISHCMISLPDISPPRYVGPGSPVGFPTTFSFGGLGVSALPNIDIFNRIVKQDSISYADVSTFTKNPAYSDNTTVLHEYYTLSLPFIRRYGSATAVGNIANSIQGTGDTAVAVAIAYSSDGSSMAYAERSIPGNPNSDIHVKTFNRIDGNWTQYGQTILVINTGTSVPNSAFTTSPYKTNQLIEMGPGGYSMIIGSPGSNSNMGRFNYCTYSKNIDTWNINANVVGDDPGSRLGESVSMIADDTNPTIAASFGSPILPSGVDVFKLNINFWEAYPNGRLESAIANASYIGTSVSTIARSGNASTPEVAIGIPHLNKVIVYVFDGVSTWSVLGAQIPAPVGATNYGRYVALSADGNRIVIGAPNSDSNRGFVEVYDFILGSWVKVGNTIRGRPNDELGFTVAISADDGSTICAGARNGAQLTATTGGITPSTGYIQVFRYDVTANLWDQIAAERNRGQTNGYSYFSKLNHSGDRLLFGSPGTNISGNTGDIRNFSYSAVANAFTNTYSCTVGLSVSGNFIRDPMTTLNFNGTTDSTPFAAPLLINTVDLGLGPVTIAALPNNTQNPANGYQKQGLINNNQNDTGGFLYFNATPNNPNGSFRYESDGTKQFLSSIDFDYTVTDGITTSTAATVFIDQNVATFLTSPVGPILPNGTVNRNVNSVVPPQEIGTDYAITVSGGIKPYTPNLEPINPIVGFGGMIVSSTSPDGFVITFSFVPDIINTAGSTSNDFFFNIEESSAIPGVIGFQAPIDYNVSPELLASINSNGSITRQVNVTNYIVSNLTSITNPIITSGGTNVDRQHTVQGSTVGTYGTLSLNFVSGAYTYTPFPNAANPLQTAAVGFSDSDIFNIKITDPTGDFKIFTYTVNVSVAPAIGITPIPNGVVAKSVTGPLTSEQGLTGSIVLTGATAVSYGTSSVTVNGTLTVNPVTGAFTYVPNTGAILNTVTFYSDVFTMTATTATNVVFTTTYTVIFNVNPQLLFAPISPSAGAVGYNTNNTTSAFTSTGLSNKLIPSGGVSTATNPYQFGIQGGIVSGSVVTLNGTFGGMSMNIFTGIFVYNVSSIPTTAGNYTDTFVFTLIDGNGDTTQLMYVINYTVASTSLGILPIFPDAENRSLINYWKFIIHDTITSVAQIIRIENTEAVVIGQTETNADPYKNVDAMIRQLLSGAIETSSTFDVVTNIKNDTEDALTTTSYDAANTYSLSLEAGTRIAEVSDVLSSQHKNFILNRGRENLIETVLMFYYDSSIVVSVPPYPNSINPTMDRIVTQVTNLINLGAKTVACIIIATNPATPPATTPTYLTELQGKQQGMLNYLGQAIQTEAAGKTAIIKSVSVRYDPTTTPATPIYQNIGYDSKGNTTQNAYSLLDARTTPSTPSTQITDVLSKQPENIEDTEYNLSQMRILITTVDGANIANGIILYANNQTTRNYLLTAPLIATSSRLFTDATRTIICSKVELPAVASNQKQTVILTQGSSGKNVTQLRPGDIVYSTTRTPVYAPPVRIELLIAVVSGVLISPIVNNSTEIFMQIGDSVRYPNNPTFKGKIVSILKKYNSTTFESVAVGTTIEYGFNYLLEIGTLENIFGAGSLELFTAFPSLGFVTLYFGRGLGNTVGVGPYGRGIVTALSIV